MSASLLPEPSKQLSIFPEDSFYEDAFFQLVSVLMDPVAMEPIRRAEAALQRELGPNWKQSSRRARPKLAKSSGLKHTRSSGGADTAHSRCARSSDS